MLNFKIPLLSLGSLRRGDGTPDKVQAPEPSPNSCPQQEQASPEVDLQHLQVAVIEGDCHSRPASPGKSSGLSRTSSVVSFPVPRPPNPKLYAAGPRSFQRSDDKRSQLETGDVIVFSTEGRLCSVVPEKHEGEAEKRHFSLKPADSGVTDADSRTHLEIVRQGDYIGFRSAAAEDRFLQARRKGTALSFFNTNLGVWEQWELVNGQPICAWNTVQLSFRSRQLPQVIVTKDVQRIGYFAVAGNAFLTPRSIDASASASTTRLPTEEAEMNAISQWAIQEHVNFIQKEKQAMAAIEGKLAKLRAEAHDAREWMISQVNDMKRFMEEDNVELEDRLTITEVELVKAWEARQRGVRFTVDALQRKRDHAALQQAFSVWRISVGHAQETRLLVRRQVERTTRTRVLPLLFSAWREHTQHKVLLNQRLYCFVDRTATRMLHAGFSALQERVHERRWLQGLADKAHRRHQVQLKRRAFECWLECMQQQRVRDDRQAGLADCLADKRQRTLIAQVCQAWQARCLEAQQKRLASFRATTFAAEKYMRKAWVGMCQEMHEMRLNAAAAAELHAEKCTAKLRANFRYWAALAATRREHGHAVRRMQARRQQCDLSMAFRQWAAHAAHLQRSRMAAGKLADMAQSAQLGIALNAWHQHTSGAQALRQRLKFYVHMRSDQICTAVFHAWADAVAARRAYLLRVTKFAARRKRKLLSACFAAVRTAVATSAATEDEARRRAEVAQHRALVGSWEAWVQHTSASLTRKRLADGLARDAQKRRLATALAAWHLRAQACKELGRIGHAIRQRHLRNTLGGVMSTWMVEAIVQKQEREDQEAAARAAAEAQRMMEVRADRLCKTHQTSWLRSLFCSWALMAAENLENQVTAVVTLQHVQQGIKMRLKSSVFRAWRNVLDHNDSKVEQFSLSQARRAQVSAFRAWQSSVRARAVWRGQLGKLAQRTDKAVLATAFTALRKQVKHRKACLQEDKMVATAMRKNLLHRTFAAWHEARLSLQQARHQLYAAVARADGPSTEAMFGTWRLLAADSRRLAVVEQRLAGRHCLLTLNHAFQAWRELVAARRAAGEKLTAVATSVRFRIQQPNQAVLMQRGPELSRIDPKKAIVAAALADWIEYTQVHLGLRKLLMEAVNRNAEFRSRCAFGAWREDARTMRVQREGVATIQQRVATGKLQAAFDQWRDVVEERRDITAQLKRCIYAKRLALQQFKIWFWRQMQAETQATLSTLYHSRPEDLTISAAITPSPASGRPSDSGRGGRIPAYLARGQENAQNCTDRQRPYVPAFRNLAGRSTLGGLSTNVPPGSRALSGSLSARRAYPENGLLVQNLRPLSGSVTARCDTPDRPSAFPAQATSRSGTMAARAASIAQEIDADIAALRPRVSEAFRSFAGHDAALRSSIAAIPLPQESSVEESDTDSSRAPSSNASPARRSPSHRCASPRFSGARSAGSSQAASSKTASASSGARSISFDQGPQDFSPLAAGALGLQDDATSTPIPQVHFYNKRDLLPPDSDVQSHRVLDDGTGTDTESNEDGYCTAWGPDTPADIARMTPGFWQGADRRGPPLHTSQTFTAPTPPPFHAGFLRHPAAVTEHPAGTPEPDQQQK